MGSIYPLAYPSKAKYLLVATNYATKWVKFIASVDCTLDTVAKFLYEHIFCRYGCPNEVTINQGTHFFNKTLTIIFKKYKIFQKKSCAYYPRANG
ncbi:hypothetical protein KP509_30G055900 [Ceratopteris richardii]|uniref:Integrase catalytic domain-containing protein n=1 Tax=Ceratopteris richardii TaxID=49495 RepID=A0A8T2R3L2_CERRI|nr:hypothetical protein KP509_30G055900 [Ceratopteris richardii]